MCERNTYLDVCGIKPLLLLPSGVDFVCLCSLAIIKDNEAQCADVCGSCMWILQALVSLGVFFEVFF